MKRIAKNTFLIHTIAFLLMILPPVLLYFAARSENVPAIWLLLSLFVVGNLLALSIK